MCYDERVFRSWATKRVQKRESVQPGTERTRPEVMPVAAAPQPEAKRHEDVERELEEIV